MTPAETQRAIAACDDYYHNEGSLCFSCPYFIDNGDIGAYACGVVELVNSPNLAPCISPEDWEEPQPEEDLS